MTGCLSTMGLAYAKLANARYQKPVGLHRKRGWWLAVTAIRFKNGANLALRRPGSGDGSARDHHAFFQHIETI